MERYESKLYRLTIPFKRLWFKFLLSRGKLIEVDERHRGVGKTTMLVNHSVKKGIPIVVGRQFSYDQMKSINENVEIYRLAKNFTIEMIGQKFPNGVLLEENIESEMIKWIKERNIDIRGGFISNYGRSKS